MSKTILSKDIIPDLCYMAVSERITETIVKRQYINRPWHREICSHRLESTVRRGTEAYDQRKREERS